ncbi:peroxiredoxin [Deinococcus roseus]|uniref:thioredoxin-dependent peroxiredoxin n=1 Tax=Deinococcus roseus TaxID=392414 RepID=A0ABQ2D0G3_9DEIO|nr:peroxiredoxin [Deinococcus roseus]GGJ32294.1 peroxiredoxin [Deinococcus roseus]
MTKLEAQQQMPDFELQDQNGTTHRLADYRGRHVVLYVYPKDDTPGCTQEACDFRDSLELKQLGAQVLGLSKDDQDSHAAFAEKFSLPFPLLSDLTGDYINEIGAWGPKNNYGKITEGIKRTTFVIDPEGKIVKAWYMVKVEGHTEAVLKAIRADLEKRPA